MDGGNAESPAPFPGRVSDMRRREQRGSADVNKTPESHLRAGGDEDAGGMSGMATAGVGGVSRPSSAAAHSPGQSPSSKRPAGQLPGQSPRSFSPAQQRQVEQANAKLEQSKVSNMAMKTSQNADPNLKMSQSRDQHEASGIQKPADRAQDSGVRPTEYRGPVAPEKPPEKTRTAPSPASVSQLMLHLPTIPHHQRLWVTAPGLLDVEGKFLKSSRAEDEWIWTNTDLGSQGESAEISYTGECWQIRTPTTTVVVSESCPATTWPEQVRVWSVVSPENTTATVSVSSTPGRRFMWDTDITAIGDPQEFEVAILAGIQELEEHIYIAHKQAYIDNVGSMYRLPRNPQAETGGAPEDFRLFDIKDFLRYLYSPEGLGWLDGRPAVLAALIYMDRIRARGRIVSRRSVHRLLVSAVLIGHEYFTQVMKEAGVTNIEPAPLEQMCQMTFLPPDSIDPLITRFKGMMDFEQAVLEQDVTSYCGALQGGVKLSDELVEEAKKERVPGQQGLSSQQDGMDSIRQWVYDVVVASRIQLPSADGPGRSSRAAAAKKPSQLGGAASRAAVSGLLRVHQRTSNAALRGGSRGTDGGRRVESPRMPPAS
eukprot:TRINITY_DN1835_c0_g1_i1.p1 TRINITY_DN1835_c0_g1~~TRINITY_DN1835_c0_g1_i1.p1  ORF type:complete len:597 (+),score=177.37 TRINITY_DN1835_c0_g1_i1:89-1879(+)